MNEQPASGSPTPAPPGRETVPAVGGQPSVPPAGDRPIDATLTMLEDKLRHLEQELAAVAAQDVSWDAPPPADEPDRAAAPTAPDAPTPAGTPDPVNAPDPVPGQAPALSHRAQAPAPSHRAQHAEAGPPAGPPHATLVDEGRPPSTPSSAPQTEAATDPSPVKAPGPLDIEPPGAMVTQSRLADSPPQSSPASPAAAAHAPSASLVGHVDELMRFRDQLDRYARALVTDYERLLGHLGAVIPHAGAARAGVADAAQEEQTQRGSVTVEAGPFGSLAEVNELERALESVESVLDCILISFEDRRASLHVRLTGPTKLVHELHWALGPGFTVLAAAPDRLSLLLSPAEGVDVGA